MSFLACLLSLHISNIQFPIEGLVLYSSSGFLIICLVFSITILLLQCPFGFRCRILCRLLTHFSDTYISVLVLDLQIGSFMFPVFLSNTHRFSAIPIYGSSFYSLPLLLYLLGGPEDVFLCLPSTRLSPACSPETIVRDLLRSPERKCQINSARRLILVLFYFLFLFSCTFPFLCTENLIQSKLSGLF